MNRLLPAALLLLCALLALPAAAQDDPEPEAERPPLLDRELFFGDPEISGAQISPDGQRIAFRKPYRDVVNIWVKETGAAFDNARPVTADTTRPVTGYFWSEDSQRILYVQDKGGNENYHVYAVNPSAEADSASGVPPARDLTPMDGVRAQILAVPEETPGEIIVGLNDRDPQWHDVYRLDLATGERTLLIQNDDEIAGWQTDLAGDVRLATRTAEDGSTEILRVMEGGSSGDSLSAPVYTCTVEETCGPMRFHKDGERVYMRTNKGEDLVRLVLFDPQSGDEELVEADPDSAVDFGGAVFSDRTDELQATYYVGDRLRYYPKDDTFAFKLETLQQKLPEGEIYFGSSTEDERLQLVSVTSDVDPGSRYLFDRTTGQATRLYQSRPELPSEHLAPMQAIRYTARDGLEIPAYLTVPKGAQAENLPAVIMPHGGPWARDTWGYDAYAQFLANRGYAVLQPNFRGSTGYGKAFLNAGNAEWGDAMQDDLTDGVQYLIDEGIADSSRIGIFGGSYGGYATLAGLAFTPDVYDAGISYVGPSNLITLLNSIPPYWASLKRVFNTRMGDLDNPEDRARLREQSPLFSADQINAPLMVIQGANDPRVKQAESDQIVVALRERDYPVTYLVAEDEGHGFRGRDNRMAVAAAMEQFLTEHLGGRVQEERSASIEETLADLTVNPDSVTLPDSLQQADAETAKTAALPEADGSVIQPATMNYEAALQVRDKQLEVKLKRTIEQAEEEGEALWRVVDAMSMPMGVTTDSFLVDAATLRPVRRNMHGLGGGAVSLRFADDRVTGLLEGGGQEIPVDEALNAPVLADGAGLELTLAGLPLEDGYETTVRSFDPAQQQVKTLKLTVTGTETVKVPAGTYETYVVRFTSVDTGEGETRLFVQQQAPHHVVKAEYALPAQMGGGTMTMNMTAMSQGSATSGTSGK